MIDLGEYQLYAYHLCQWLIWKQKCGVLKTKTTNAWKVYNFCGVLNCIYTYLYSGCSRWRVSKCKGYQVSNKGLHSWWTPLISINDTWLIISSAKQYASAFPHQINFEITMTTNSSLFDSYSWNYDSWLTHGECEKQWSCFQNLKYDYKHFTNNVKKKVVDGFVVLFIFFLVMSAFVCHDRWCHWI